MNATSGNRLLDLVAEWRQQASAEEHCQRSGGNLYGARAYRTCADELEALLKELEKEVV